MCLGWNGLCHPPVVWGRRADAAPVVLEALATGEPWVMSPPLLGVSLTSWCLRGACEQTSLGSSVFGNTLRKQQLFFPVLVGAHCPEPSLSSEEMCLIN